MNPFKLIVVLISFLHIGLSYADSGHDLLKKCEAAVERQDMESSKRKINEIRIKEQADTLNSEDIQELNKIVNGTQLLRASQCLSYISGFGGANSLSPLKRKGKTMFCVPKDVSVNEVAALTVRWMRKNTDKLHFGAHEVLAMSNIVNFPCPRT